MKISHEVGLMSKILHDEFNGSEFRPYCWSDSRHLHSEAWGHSMQRPTLPAKQLEVRRFRCLQILEYLPGIALNIFSLVW